MKTRKSTSGVAEVVKESLEISHQEYGIIDKVSPPIVRKLRSRVITPDIEDVAHVRNKTPKSQRKANKDNAKFSSPDCDEVTKSHTVGLATKTPKSKKRLSAVNLFRIVEEKEEVNAEEYSDKDVRESRAKCEVDEVGISSIYHSPVEETVIPSNEVVKEDISMPSENEEEFSDQENGTTSIKEEVAESKELQEGQPMGSDQDSDSDDNMPEAVSFSQSKNTVSMELTAIAEAIRREKEKNKDRARRKIEMIKIQKAEKEKKKSLIKKFVEVSVPERLPDDVVSSLPDRPGIPTVKKSVSINKKRKNNEKGKLEHKAEEKKNKIMKFDDYIPITGVAGSTQFGVVPLEVTSRLPKPSSQSAAEFKRNTLFGSRLKREPSKNLLIYRQKLSAGGNLSNGYRSSNLLKIH